MYGPKNKFNNSFSNAELALLLRLIDKKSKTSTTMARSNSINHSIPTKFAVASNPKVFKQAEQTKTKFFFDYDMVQAEKMD
jgi:hypothetical protein